MSVRLIFFTKLSILERNDSNGSLLIETGPQEQRNHLWFFLFASAGIGKKPETGIRKRSEAGCMFNNRARATGQHKQISIPDLKKDWWQSLTITGKADASKFYTSPRDVFLNTGLDRSSQRKISLIVSHNVAPNMRSFCPSSAGRPPIRCHATYKHGDRNKRARANVYTRTKAHGKEMDAENTRLAAGNNFLLQRRARRSVLVRSVIPKAYLAINWQPVTVETRFTCGDLRFATPVQQVNTTTKAPKIRCAVTASDVFWPNERRRIAFSRPIVRSGRQGGGGVQPGAPAESARRESSHRNFIPKGDPPRQQT
jgi:hypothetical protein